MTAPVRKVVVLTGLAATVALAPLAALARCDLGKLFAEKESWKMSAVDFTASHAKEGFKFASQKRDIVNCLKRGGAAFHGVEAWEAKVYFGKEGAKRAEISLYNRGDDRQHEGFTQDDLDRVTGDIAEAVGGSKTLPPAQKREIPGGYQFVRTWSKADPVVELAWGVVGKGKKDSAIAYVRAMVEPKGKTGPAGATKAVSGAEAKKRVKANVMKNTEGDVWVANVPMVDQGQKGYCAVAVTERVLRYFGQQIDEHELAQLAGTTSCGGTSVSAMKEVVKSVGSKCRLGYGEIVSMIAGVKDVEKEIEHYNKAAKSEKCRELALSEFTFGHRIDISAMHEAMEPMVLKKMRVKDARYKKFLAGVKAQVDQGNPVIWSVRLGIFPEPELPQTRGGHMRLVIGYNQKTNEILYSDSWGSGHELKRMPEDWAFAITDDAFFLRPL